MNPCDRAAPAPFSGLKPSLLLSAVWRLGCSWAERRRQRLALAALDQRLLRDIGLTSGEAMRETDKPFWRV